MLSEETKEGMKRAEDKANRVHENWSTKAERFLMRSLKRRKHPFMTEDLRTASKRSVPPPPSNRAWGGVIHRAASNGYIKRVGVKSVKNKKAHGAYATVWRSTITY